MAARRPTAAIHPARPTVRRAMREMAKTQESRPVVMSTAEAVQNVIPTYLTQRWTPSQRLRSMLTNPYNRAASAPARVTVHPTLQVVNRQVDLAQVARLPTITSGWPAVMVGPTPTSRATGVTATAMSRATVTVTRSLGRTADPVSGAEARTQPRHPAYSVTTRIGSEYAVTASRSGN